MYARSATRRLRAFNVGGEMTKVEWNDITLLRKTTRISQRPLNISKTNYKFFKKFGYNKCLWCKEYFIKHRETHFYCSKKCATYHYRKKKKVKSNLFA